MFKKFHFLFLIFILGADCMAQDFNINVKVSDDKIQKTDKGIFRRLEQDIKQFVTNYKWSADRIQSNESVDWYLEIILNSYDPVTGDFTASAIVQSRRPVYGTNYNSVIFN